MDIVYKLIDWSDDIVAERYAALSDEDRKAINKFYKRSASWGTEYPPECVKFFADRGVTYKLRKDACRYVIKQYTMDGVLVAEYYTYEDAGRASGVDVTNIRGACSGLYKSAGSFVWVRETLE